MKLLIINSVLSFGSTGRIALETARKYEQEGYEVKAAYGRDFGRLPEEAMKYGVRIGNDMDVYVHGTLSRLTGKHGLYSRKATKDFLKWADEFDPDIIWLHNIHGYYINYELLFDWIKSRPQMQVKWTLHDCWTFTGHCAYFTYARCDKWMNLCENCPQLGAYPRSFFDNSRNNYLRKKEAFTGVKNLTLITPSKWLADLLKKSYLAEYPVEVVYNTIDKSIFKPRENAFKADNNIADKRMILGVANTWEKRKGLEDFIKLAELMDEEKYHIVLVGLSDKQIKELEAYKSRITALPRTAGAAKLAELYSAADVFVNPTYEDNYPTVNLEAEACGTRVITYNTGGSAETLGRSDSVVIEPGVNNILKEL